MKTVWDVGGHAGYYTLVFSQLVGPAGRVYTFEPSPENLVNLLRHVRLNQVENVRVLSMALSDAAGFSPFVIENDSSCSHLGNGDRLSLSVATRTMDQVVDEGLAEPPAFIKMDVEGAESRVLSGGLATLARFKPVLSISLHSRQEAEECGHRLAGLGYKLSTLDGTSWNGPASGDELVALP